MKRSIEMVEYKVEEMTKDFYKRLAERSGLEWTWEEINEAVRAHQDTISDEDMEEDEDEMEEKWEEWMEDRSDEIIQAKQEELIQEAVEGMERALHRRGSGRIAYIVIDERPGLIEEEEYPSIEEACNKAEEIYRRERKNFDKPGRQVSACVCIMDFNEDGEEELDITGWNPVKSYGRLE